MEAYGCGARAAIEPNDVPPGQEKNERIDLLLLDPAPDSGVRSTKGCVSSE
jgi:flagellar motor protein MotB